LSIAQERNHTGAFSMSLIPAETAPRFEMHGAQFTGLAAPSRGARETAVWRVRLVPANTDFALANAIEEPFEAVVVLPVGGMAQVGDAAPFTPPWAA
jgi:hypothetical protein